VRNIYNPGANLDAGIRHLRSLMDRFELSLALAAYNAGEAAVRKFGGIPPYRETQDYVARVLALARTLP
jgi:soluble lytic murein transglycosylase-like protein